jgi:hypothetical protein
MVQLELTHLLGPAGGGPEDLDGRDTTGVAQPDLLPER